MFQAHLNHKPGVFQPVTGQATVVVTTCVDEQHMAQVQQSEIKPAENFPLASNDKKLLARVESHCIALKKKNSKSRYFKGSGCDLKIITALNGMKRDEIINKLEHVGIVQTPINPSQLSFC